MCLKNSQRSFFKVLVGRTTTKKKKRACLQLLISVKENQADLHRKGKFLTNLNLQCSNNKGNF